MNRIIKFRKSIFITILITLLSILTIYKIYSQGFTSITSGDYYVCYIDDPVSIHYCPLEKAEWVLESFVHYGDYLTDESLYYEFESPYFSSYFKIAYIYNMNDPQKKGMAPTFSIMINSQYITDPGTEKIHVSLLTLNLLFKHIQYAYIKDNTYWYSWGEWTLTGSAVSMEDKAILTGLIDIDDNDADLCPDCTYISNANDYLANPNITLTDQSDEAGLFWNYLCEQLGFYPFEPDYNPDVIQRYWYYASLFMFVPNSIGMVETINQYFSGSEKDFEDTFMDFCIANYNYTNELDITPLDDEFEDRYYYQDQISDGIVSLYNPVATSTVAAWNTSYTSSVVRWGAKYFDIDTSSIPICKAIGFRGSSDTDKTLGWVLIGISGDTVKYLYSGTGDNYQRILINSAGNSFTRLVAIVIGLDEGDTFSYEFISGDITAEVLLPTLLQQAFVGDKASPQRFQIRLLVQGSSGLLLPGGTSSSVKGLDPSDFRVIVEESGGAPSYEATVINGEYVNGEYWLVASAPEIDPPDPTPIDYDLNVYICDDGGSYSVSALKEDSVSYLEVKSAQMLLFDCSASMSEPLINPKIESAKSAANMYVNSFPDNNWLGIASFSSFTVSSECDHEAGLDQSLMEIVDITSRNQLISKINNSISASTGTDLTALGDGLKEAYNELQSVPSPTLPPLDFKAIILMSDGKENRADYWDQSDAGCGSSSVKSLFLGSGNTIPVHTIAFGTDADEAKMQDIATTTNGSYYFVSDDPVSAATRSNVLITESMGSGSGNRQIKQIDWLDNIPLISSLEIPNRLAHIFLSIKEKLHSQDRLYYTAKTIEPNVSEIIEIPIFEGENLAQQATGGIQKAFFSFNWNDKDAKVDIILSDPNGIPVTGSNDWKVYRYEEQSDFGITNTVFAFNNSDNNLQNGLWNAIVTSDRNIQLLFAISANTKAGVNMNLHFNQEKVRDDNSPDIILPYLRGLPVIITVNLNDCFGKIKNASVKAEIYNPTGTLNTLFLFDDGKHEDGAPDDGIYGNIYRRTPYFSNDFTSFPKNIIPNTSTGSYDVTVTAYGISNYRDTFSRYITRSFHITDYAPHIFNTDADDDNMADRWEDLVGLNKNDPSDRNIDNDRDGLINLTEYEQGTHPFKADTDGGGESDESEIRNDRDPLNEKDDAISPIVEYKVLTDSNSSQNIIKLPNTNILSFSINSEYKYIEIWRAEIDTPEFKLIKRIDLEIGPISLTYDEGLINDTVYFYYLVAESQDGARTAPTEIFSGTPEMKVLDIRINFQPKESRVPLLYYPDYGETYKIQNGYIYGWNYDHERFTEIKQGSNSNLRNDTLCNVNFDSIWRIKLPDGLYNITIGQYSSLLDENIVNTGSLAVVDGFLRIETGDLVNDFSAINYLKISNQPIQPTPTPDPEAGSVWFEPKGITVFHKDNFFTDILVNSGNKVLGSYSFDIFYNTDIISLNRNIGINGIEPGSDGFITTVNIDTPGIIKLDGFDPTGRGPGNRLHVIKINLTTMNFGESQVEIVVNSLLDISSNVIGRPRGKIDNIIVNLKKSDVSGDGIVDILDALLIARYYVGLPVAGFILEVCDNTNDGMCTILDALRVARYYVGLIPEL